METSTAIYPFGYNNIFYKATGFAKEITVTCYIWNPRLDKTGLIMLTELDYGLYYFSHNFREYGVHHAIFFEDGEVKKFHAFRIEYQSLRLP